MNQATDVASGLLDAHGMDRFASVFLFLLALACLGGACLLLLNDFIEYLQLGRWRVDTLLDSGYRWHLLRSRWFLASDLGAAIREVLRVIPTFLALLLVAPLAWWFSNRFGER
ncbi:MAG TPA: hypothetical protein VIS76_16355 [Pseudomonadales bacterium]